MSQTLDLSIIIVNWHSAEFVRRCIHSIREQTSGLAYEVLVVDNASSDGCEQMLRRHFPDVVFVQSDTNLGFAKANNLAFEKSRGASLLFLNPDTEIMGPAIPLLHHALHRLPGAGISGARLLNGDGSLQTSCIQSFPTIVNQVMDFECLRRRWPQSGLWGMAPLYSRSGATEEAEVISGACLMIRREVFERVGRFSEEYFMYSEDLDLCYKVKQSGWKNYYVPQAAVVHFGGSSSQQAASNFSNVMMRESVWRFLRKTRGDLYGLGYRGAMLLVASCRLGLLGILLPTQALRTRRKSWAVAATKWWEILLWSIRLTQQLKQS